MKKVISMLLALILLVPFMPASIAGQEIIAHGIDVSRWQGEIDFAAVKASGVDFVIIRIGYSSAIDINFEKNYAAARAAGLDIGAYFYSYAENTEEAVKDARDAAAWLKGKRLEYPLYYDIEDEVQAPLSKRELTDLAVAFMDEGARLGWYTGLYSNENWFTNYYEQGAFDGYPLWLAKWPKSGKPDNTPDAPYGLWQYSSKGRVPGISTDVDLDVAFFDYPSYIKKRALNGYKGPDYDPDLPFDDVKMSAWYYESVKEVYERGIFNGLSESKFGPDGSVTRGMFATIIGRMWGIDTAQYTDPGFVDVSPKAYYAPYIEWARESGIVDGIGMGHFCPDDFITREQMCAMIYRFAEFAGIALEGEETTFKDEKDISSWAKEGVHALAAAGIVRGMGGGIFSPKSGARRSECAAITVRIPMPDAEQKN